MMLEKQVLISCCAASLSLPYLVGGQVYWWYYPKADCGYDDILENCSGKSVEVRRGRGHNLNVNDCIMNRLLWAQECKAKCQATKGCGGFNVRQELPHSVMPKLA